MTVHSIRNIYSAWVQVGGNTGDLAVYMTAIALAESGGDDQAISPSLDYGVWQINIIHQDEFPKLWPQRFTILGSARMAKALSGNGTNIGPWCTVWEDPKGNCGHYHAPPPDADSPAGRNVARVAQVIGAHPPPLGHPAHPTGPPDRPGEHAWTHWQRILGPAAKDWDHRLSDAHNVLRRI